MDTHLNSVQKTSVRFKRALCVGLASALVAITALTALADETGTVAATSLYVRKSASTEAKALCSVRKGQHVTILSTDGDWYKVKTGETIGYCAKEYITLNAKESTTSSESLGTIDSLGDAPATSKPGDEGNKVLKLQKALTIKGHYAGRLSGHYGDLTKKAVEAFQRSKGLSADGIAGKKTIKALFGEEAANAKAEETKKTYKTERLNWFHGANGSIPNGSTITIKDVETGKTFKAKRRFGTNHLDAEPVDADATKTMKEIFGGSWSWSRRAVLVLYNGHVYAGSINGMPHAPEDENIKNNKFDGVFCIHFYGSKTHGSDKVDKEHQNQVAKAMKATW